MKITRMVLSVDTTNEREIRLYHLVYITTNAINGKIYVGVRSTWNLEDKYLGSGDKLKTAFKKYGKQSFKRTLLLFN
jgi:hypothetical protein